MRSDRFDQVTRRIAEHRLSRRATLQKGGTGLAAAAFGMAGIAGTAAQEATPATGAESEATMLLFTQTFEGGTWEPKAGETDLYVLTLIGASAQTAYFSDRPERIFGLTPTQQFLNQLGFTPENPPNAAIVAETPDGEDVVIIELLNPVYDHATATLTYDARVLTDYEGAALAHAAVQQTDFELVTPFGQGGLFIDSLSGGPSWTCDCASICTFCVQTVSGIACAHDFTTIQPCTTEPCTTDADCGRERPVCLLGVADIGSSSPRYVCGGAGVCASYSVC